MWSFQSYKHLQITLIASLSFWIEVDMQKLEEVKTLKGLSLSLSLNNHIDPPTHVSYSAYMGVFILST